MTFSNCHVSLTFVPSLPTAHSPLGDCVIQIVLMRSREKMIGIDAQFVVAVVAHKIAVWNLSAKQSPRHAMGKIFAFFGGSNANSSISSTIDCTRPVPASSCLIN